MTSTLTPAHDGKYLDTSAHHDQYSSASAYDRQHLDASAHDDPEYFPPGNYRLDLYIRDDLVASGHFDISE